MVDSNRGSHGREACAPDAGTETPAAEQGGGQPQYESLKGCLTLAVMGLLLVAVIFVGYYVAADHP